MSRLVVVAGPSAVGKGTLVGALRAKRADVWVSVSATTRQPRPGELEGVHYFFVTDAEFSRMIADVQGPQADRMTRMFADALWELEPGLRQQLLKPRRRNGRVWPIKPDHRYCRRHQRHRS